MGSAQKQTQERHGRKQLTTIQHAKCCLREQAALGSRMKYTACKADGIGSPKQGKDKVAASWVGVVGKSSQAPATQRWGSSSAALCPAPPPKPDGVTFL